MGPLERDGELCETFFQDLDAVFYAAAALPQHLWEKLERLSVDATGRRVAMLSAWGSTETAPSATQIHFLIEQSPRRTAPWRRGRLRADPPGAFKPLTFQSSSGLQGGRSVFWL